jgi:hypothetical protein
MGYYTRYTGRIDIDPPLPWHLIKDSPALPESTINTDIKLVIERDEVETEEGTLVRRYAVAIIPSHEDAFRGYDMVKDVQAVVNRARAAAVTTFTGRIDAVGEDGERWRIKVVDGQVGEFQPVLVWPPESE